MSKPIWLWKTCQVAGDEIDAKLSDFAKLKNLMLVSELLHVDRNGIKIFQCELTFGKEKFVQTIAVGTEFGKPETKGIRVSDFLCAFVSTLYFCKSSDSYATRFSPDEFIELVGFETLLGPLYGDLVSLIEEELNLGLQTIEKGNE